jgi:hypothetical protein
MAATSAVKTGVLCACLRNTGSYGSPTWTEMTLVKDVTDNSKWDMGDASIRATRVKLYAKTQVDLPQTINMRADDADTAYVAMFDAWASATTVVDLLILDGDIATEGAMGVRGEFLVTNRPQNQEIGGVIYTAFDLLPAWTSNGYPKSVKMGAASSPSFTSF